MQMTFTPRLVGLIAIAALGIGWFGSSVTHDRGAQQSRVPSGVRALGSGPATVPRAEKLRQRLVEPPVPGRGRNPFVYGTRVAPRSTSYRDRSPEAEAPVAPPAPAPEAPAVPLFRLSGVAADVKDGETTFTAILIDNGAMVFVRNGDKLSNGYSVVRVDEMSVTIVDADGVTQTIRLP
jgi:hypothetical protein